MIIRFHETVLNKIVGPWLWQFDPDEITQVYYKEKTHLSTIIFILHIEKRDGAKIEVDFVTAEDRKFAFEDLWLAMTTLSSIPENKFYKKEYKDAIEQAMSHTTGF